jgi:hypothetical protein
MTHSHPNGAATVEVKCQRCKQPFVARVADRKRGWGKFCSKSCKAIKQTQRTGYAGPRAAASYRCSECGDEARKYIGAGQIEYLCDHHAADWAHPFSSDGLGQW